MSQSDSAKDRDMDTIDFVKGIDSESKVPEASEGADLVTFSDGEKERGQALQDYHNG